VNEIEKMHYVEFPAKDISATRGFFGEVFGRTFQAFGPDYSVFAGGGINGGFYRSGLCSSIAHGAALIVLYSADLESLQDRIEKAGGAVVKAIFSFPGGRRFHFTEPSGNELAVWSEKGA